MSDKILNTRNVKYVLNGAETGTETTRGIVPDNIKIASTLMNFYR